MSAMDGDPKKIDKTKGDDHQPLPIAVEAHQPLHGRASFLLVIARI
jgi:hypothetical protein